MLAKGDTGDEAVGAAVVEVVLACRLWKEP